MSTAPRAAFKYFYAIALEYYVSGRAALFCGSTFITGNLLHHAVEMLLKGQLSKTIPLAELKDRDKFGHRLPQLWTALKVLFATEDLTGFDAMIAELEEFEKIRYPDEILDRGAFIGIGYGRGKPVTNIAGRTAPQFQIGVGDVDAFFARLFPLCRLNPKAYLSFLSSRGQQVLTEGNPESQDWLPS